MAFLKGKYVQNSTLDGSKIKLKNGEALKGAKADGSEKEIVKVNGQDKVEFPEAPVVSQDPQTANELARKAYVDAQREAAKAHSDAKDALQDAALAAEATAREAGDSALDARLDALESSTSDKDYVDQKVLEEKQLREAADAELDARLDAIEADPVTKAYVDAGDQGAKDYADQKIADLVNSAPATLDTLKELADAIAAGETVSQGLLTLIGQTDDKIDAEVINRQSADQVLDDKIDQEIADRQAGDASLDSRLDALEALPSPVVNSMAGTQTDKAPSVAAAKAYIDAIGMGQTKYVSVGGSDANQGTLAKPYLTIAAAMASITDASPTKRYVIRVGAGNFVESSIALKANVFIVGESDRSTRITGALSLASDFTGGSDHRSGLVTCTMLSACNFDLAAVTSGAGKIYCDNVLFNSTVTFNAYSAISQGFMNNCLFFGAYTQNGHNQTARNCVWYSTITLNPVATTVPNHTAVYGGLEIQGGSFGDVTLNTPNGRGEQKITVKNGVSQGKLTINGPKGYAFVTPTFTKANIVTTDGGRFFRYSDAYTMSYSSSEGAWWGDWTAEIEGSPVYPDDVLTALDMLGKGLFYRHWYEKNSVIHADGSRAMAANLSLGSNKITGLVAGSAATDAVNKGQLDAGVTEAKGYADQKVADLVNGAPEMLDTLKELADALAADQSGLAALVAQVGTLQSGLAQELLDRAAGDAALQGEIDAEETRALAAEAALQAEIDAVEAGLAQEVSDRAAQCAGLAAGLAGQDARLTALEAAPGLRCQKEMFTLSAQDVSNGYVDCAYIAAPMSMVLYVGGIVHFENEDYALSDVGGKTRITFMGDLVIPSTGALVEGDMVRVQYMTSDSAGGEGGGGGGEGGGENIAPVVTSATVTNVDATTANVNIAWSGDAQNLEIQRLYSGSFIPVASGPLGQNPTTYAGMLRPEANTSDDLWRVRVLNSGTPSPWVEFTVQQQEGGGGGGGGGGTPSETVLYNSIVGHDGLSNSLYPADHIDGPYQIAQNLSVASYCVLTKVSFLANGSDYLSSGKFKIEIQTADPNAPFQPSGLILGESSGRDVSSIVMGGGLNGGFSEYEVLMPNIPLAPGETYIVIFKEDETDPIITVDHQAGMWVSRRNEDVAPGYSSIFMRPKGGGEPYWFPFETRDLQIKLTGIVTA